MNPKDSRKNLATRDKRLEIIAPLLHKQYRTREKLRRIADDNEISVRTLKRWLSAYDKHGIRALTPNYRGSNGQLRRYIRFDELLKQACAMRAQDPYVSVANIIYALEENEPNIKGILKRSTLQRHLQRQHCSRRELLLGKKLSGRRSFGRYAKTHSLDLVQTDIKEFSGCRIYDESGNPVKIYLSVFIDSMSSLILSYKIWTDQKQHIVLDPMREMIETYGLPSVILTDNGTIYTSRVMRRACAKLGVTLKYCRPRRPEAKGKVERFYGLIDAIQNQFAPLGKAPFAMYAACINQWIASYNASPREALNNRSPKDVFFTDTKCPVPADPELLSEAFKRSAVRKVAKDGTISLNGVTFQIPHALVRVGDKVELLISGEPDAEIVEMVNEDSSTTQIFPLQIKPDVDKNALVNSPSRTPTLNDAGFVLALLRNQCKKDGSYTTEEEFRKYIQEQFDSLPPEAKSPAEHDGPGKRNESPASSRGPEPASPYLTMSQKQQEKSHHD